MSLLRWVQTNIFKMINFLLIFAYLEPMGFFPKPFLPGVWNLRTVVWKLHSVVGKIRRKTTETNWKRKRKGHNGTGSLCQEQTTLTKNYWPINALVRNRGISRSNQNKSFFLTHSATCRIVGNLRPCVWNLRHDRRNHTGAYETYTRCVWILHTVVGKLRPWKGLLEKRPTSEPQTDFTGS